MERLTRRMCRSWSVIPGYELSTVKGMQAVVDRLAAYEDTGLEPEEVVQTKLALMGKVLAEIKEFDGVPVNRMIELAQAEKEGRLVILPDTKYTDAIAEKLCREKKDENPPLTLEKLRGMDGEPVFIIPTRGSGGFCTWMLVDTKYDLCREVHGEMAVFENCGKTWLAYRRKPENQKDLGGET